MVGISACTTTVPGTATSALSLITPDQLCPGTGTGRADAEALVSCVTDALSVYWTSEVGRPVNEAIAVAPDPATVPEDCRSFLSFGTAFFCPANTTVYLTGAALDRDAIAFGDELPYAVAGIVAHEMGHVVQDVVNQPAFEDSGDANAASRAIEQQADCLVGAWADHAAGSGVLNPERFRAAYEQELRIIGELPLPADGSLDGYDEVATHGTVAERIGAYDTGAAAGSGAACGLVGLD